MIYSCGERLNVGKSAVNAPPALVDIHTYLLNPQLYSKLINAECTGSYDSKSVGLVRHVNSVGFITLLREIFCVIMSGQQTQTRIICSSFTQQCFPDKTVQKG